MIDKATIAIQKTSICELAILEYNGFHPVNKDWPNLKSHFVKAYNARLRSGAGTTNANGYHGAADATDGVDNDSIAPLTKS